MFTLWCFVIDRILGRTNLWNTSLQPRTQSCDDHSNFLESIDNVDDLIARAKALDVCPTLNKGPNFVFSDGDIKSSLMLIGEAPGAEEDKQGKPFVGASGMLLRKALKAAGLEQAYITNTVFWRPENNRTPTQKEIDACLPFVKKHIHLAAPRLIVLVGAVAARAILGDSQGIGKLVGNFFETTIEGRLYSIRPIFHPAYILRSPSQKRIVWKDLMAIAHFLNKSI